MAATEYSLCGGGGSGVSASSGAIATGAGEREATSKTSGGGIDEQRRAHAGCGSQAKHWGLWHESGGMNGEWDDTDGGRAHTEPAHSSGPDARQGDRCVVFCADRAARVSKK